MINRKHNSISTYCSHRIHEVWRREMAGCRYPDILLKIVAKRLLHGESLVTIVPNHPMINAPKVSRRHLAQMTDDKLDSREAIENTVGAHAQDVPLHVLPELQRCYAEPPARVPKLLLKMW